MSAKAFLEQSSPRPKGTGADLHAVYDLDYKVASDRQHVNGQRIHLLIHSGDRGIRVARSSSVGLFKEFKNIQIIQGSARSHARHGSELHPFQKHQRKTLESASSAEL